MQQLSYTLATHLFCYDNTPLSTNHMGNHVCGEITLPISIKYETHLTFCNEYSTNKFILLNTSKMNTKWIQHSLTPNLQYTPHYNKIQWSGTPVGSNIWEDLLAAMFKCSGRIRHSRYLLGLLVPYKAWNYRLFILLVFFRVSSYQLL